MKEQKIEMALALRPKITGKILSLNNNFQVQYILKKCKKVLLVQNLFSKLKQLYLYQLLKIYANNRWQTIVYKMIKNLQIILVHLSPRHAQPSSLFQGIRQSLMYLPRTKPQE